jgi:hypothetical protein
LDIPRTGRGGGGAREREKKSEIFLGAMLRNSLRLVGAVGRAAVGGAGVRASVVAHQVAPACWSAFNLSVPTRESGWGLRFASTTNGTAHLGEEGAEAEAEQDASDAAEVLALEEAVSEAERQFYADIRAAKQPAVWRGRPSDAVGKCELASVSLYVGDGVRVACTAHGPRGCTVEPLRVLPSDKVLRSSCPAGLRTRLKSSPLSTLFSLFPLFCRGRCGWGCSSSEASMVVRSVCTRGAHAKWDHKHQWARVWGTFIHLEMRKCRLPRMLFGSQLMPPHTYHPTACEHLLTCPLSITVFAQQQAPARLDILHRVVVWQRREWWQGTTRVKNRNEVRGGGK